MATITHEESGVSGSKWGFKPNFRPGKEESEKKSNNFGSSSSNQSNAGKYRFWKRGNTKTPGTITQVRGAQYPPIMDSNQMNKFNKKRHSASVNSNQNKNKNNKNDNDNNNGNDNVGSDSYLNYKSNFDNNSSSILIHNHHIANSNKRHILDHNIHHNQNSMNNNKNDSSIKNGNIGIGNNRENNKNEKIEKDGLNENQSGQSKIEKNGNDDLIPTANIDELIESAQNDLQNGNDNSNEMNENNNNKNDNKNDNKGESNKNENENENEMKRNDKWKNKTSMKGKGKGKGGSLKEWDEIKSESEAQVRKNHNRTRLLTKMIEQPMLDSNQLRKSCWRGVPRDMRPTIWKLLLGYTPKNKSRRGATLKRKRGEYYNLVERYYTHTQKEHRSDQENQIVHQISLDVPRTSPELRLFQIPNISKVLSRALYIWSHRHTATGYVQGINDLITPFVYIFLNKLLIDSYKVDLDLPQSRDIVKQLTEKELLWIEADSYWCLDYLIEGLQLNYTDGQPGIQNMIDQLEEVISRVNAPLAQHFKKEKLEYIQFSFRWMNCLLMRELPLHHIIRLWDTYLCEGVELSAGFSEFHVFVCAALLLCFADQLMKKDFAEIMLFIQALPEKTKKWKEREIETILSEAYVYQQLYGKTKKALYN